MTDPLADIKALIEDSSLGTPGAKNLRERTSSETRAAIKARTAKDEPSLAACEAKLRAALHAERSQAFVCSVLDDMEARRAHAGRLGHNRATDWLAGLALLLILLTTLGGS